MKIPKALFFVCLFFAQMVGNSRDIAVEQNSKSSDKRIKIGLLIQDSLSTDAIKGAEMAIQKANEGGSSVEHSFELLTHSMEGPWGIGSKMAVDLIFEGNVWAILGSHDGRNAHLVEQVTAKSQIVYLSAWASDPTLSQAFVPWYFSCVPNDLEQADLLVQEIVSKRKISKVAVISENDYDSDMARKCFLKKTINSGKLTPIQLIYDNSLNNFQSIIDKIRQADIKGIVFYGSTPAASKFIQQIRHLKMNQPVFCSFTFLDKSVSPEFRLGDYENVVFVSPGNWIANKDVVFRNEFLKRYKKIPGSIAAYAFDGMNMIIDAIRNSGFDRNKLQKVLLKSQYQGITGVIRFDQRGNRMDAKGLIEIHNGKLKQIEN